MKIPQRNRGELRATPKFFRGKTSLSYQQAKEIALTFGPKDSASTPEEKQVTFELERLWIDHGGEA